MAESTIGTYLGYADIPSSTTSISEYQKLADITDYSDLESAPETIDVTTMSNKKRVYIQGLPDQPQQTYTALYDPTLYFKIKKMELARTKKAFCLLMEESNSLLTWQGGVSVQLAGGGVNEARTMTISITAETEISLDATESGNAVTITKWYYHDATGKINKTA